MPPTDLSERAFEARAVARLAGPALVPAGAGALREDRPVYVANGQGNLAAGWVEGDPRDFDRTCLIDVPALLRFLHATQPRAFDQLGLTEEGPRREQFLQRLAGEIAKRGVVDVLRRGMSHRNVSSLALFYGAPTPGNRDAAARHAANEFRVTRQLRYSQDETARALDLVLFVNGLPLATFELKNQLTRQNVEDAIIQYKRDRGPHEPLFKPGRCAVHFAVDENHIRSCTELRGADSIFLPFDRGYDDGAGNPPNPDGLRTDWLWDDILAPASLTDIIENYAQRVTESGANGKKRERHLWPRYHQLDAVRRLLADASRQGPGWRYLIQHSAGSGKSNTIAWLVHQLIDLQTGAGRPVFDTVIVVTDRVILDRQLRGTIGQFTQVAATVGAAERSGDLRRFIEGGKRIVVSTVQKFPYIVEEIGDAHRDRTFAIVIDEAHSSQGGKAAGAINQTLGERDRGPGEIADADDDAGDSDDEDRINQTLDRLIAGRKLLDNASYFAFTATPKNKTLEIFGSLDPARPGAKKPFHVYTMKQAIQEGFIVDVLANYTPVRSWYRLVKTVEGDPEYDVREASKALRRYVENHDHAIRTKAVIAADHFRDKVAGKIGGRARAMVVVDGVNRAIEWWRALSDYLEETHSPYKAIVAFSGEREWGGARVTEATLNRFSSQDIPERIRQDPYRFLVVSDKFQTGYDEPLLHTMYVDKVLAGVKAVQTLSRLNRAAPGKRDAFVLDFANDEETIRAAFEPYYRTTILSGETDPNKLYDLQARLDEAGVYDPEQVAAVVEAFLCGAGRERIDPALDGCVDRYRALEEDGQIAFKGGGKAFVRTYAFLATILPWANRRWERLSIFLNLLLPKLPAPIDRADPLDDLLDAVDLDSYRAEMLATIDVGLRDEDGALKPVPAGGDGSTPDDETARLSAIVAEFNQFFGNIPWTNKDRIVKVIAELPEMVSADRAYQNAMRHNDRQNARIEHDRALRDTIFALMNDHFDLFKNFSDDEQFKRFLSDRIFGATYRPPTAMDRG